MHYEFVEIKSGNQRLPLFLLATDNGELTTDNGHRHGKGLRFSHKNAIPP